MLPTFIVIGSAQSGTTSLYHVFSEHPQIFMSRKKELHFFVKEHWYRRGIEQYERHFPEELTQGKMAVGEATPVYICHPRAPERIARHVPDVKMILTVRNPVQRAYSQYWRKRRDLTETGTFEEALEQDLTPEYVPGRRGYFNRGLYLHYIERYLQHFNREQLLVLTFDELSEDPHSFYARCFEFIGVDPSFRSAAMTRRFNSSAIWNNPLYNYLFTHPGVTRRLPLRIRRAFCVGPKRQYSYPPIDPSSRERLAQFYREPNRRLGEFLGTDLSRWDS